MSKTESKRIKRVLLILSFINSCLQGYSPKKVEDIYSYCAPHIFGHNPWRVRKEASSFSSSASYSHSSYSCYSYSSYSFSSSSSASSSLKFKESKTMYFQTSDNSDKSINFYGMSPFYCIFSKGNSFNF